MSPSPVLLFVRTTERTVPLLVWLPATRLAESMVKLPQVTPGALHGSVRVVVAVTVVLVAVLWVEVGSEPFEEEVVEVVKALAIELEDAPPGAGVLGRDARETTPTTPRRMTTMAATAMTAVPTAGLRGVKADGFLTVGRRLLHFCPNGRGFCSVDEVAAHAVPLWVVLGLRNENPNPIAERMLIEIGKIICIAKS